MKSAVAILLLALGLLFPAVGHAKVIYQASEGGIRILLTDEPCALAEVTNLPNRAQWMEGDKAIEGCFVPHPAGFVIAYFADKTVAVIPTQVFTKAEGV